MLLLLLLPVYCYCCYQCTAADTAATVSVTAPGACDFAILHEICKKKKSAFNNSFNSTVTLKGLIKALSRNLGIVILREIC